MLKARSGYWHVDFRLPSGRRVRTTTGVPLDGGSKADAWKAHERIEREELGVDEAQPKRAAVGSGMTLKEAFKVAMHEHERWRSSKSPRTISDNYAHVAGHFGDTRALASIQHEDVSEYKRALLSAGKAPGTINQRLSLLSVLFKVAQEQGVKVDRPRMVRARVRPGRIRILSREEEADVVHWFQSWDKPIGATMADLVVCLVDTGFRLSEMLRVTSGDIDQTAGTVAAWETKADVPRRVPMTRRVRALLEARDGWSGLTVDSADDHWATMRRALGLQGDSEFVLHALRHTCCSRMVAAGMDAFRVQKWMGHKSIQTTMRYVTLYAPDLCDLARALECVPAPALANRSPAVETIGVGSLSTVNPQVPGSSPGRGAKQNKDLQASESFSSPDVPKNVPNFSGQPLTVAVGPAPVVPKEEL